MVLCLRALATQARDLGLVPSSCRSFQGDRIGLLVSSEYQAHSW